MNQGGHYYPTRRVEYERSEGYVTTGTYSGASLHDHYASIAFREYMKALIDGSVDDLTLEVIAIESHKAAQAMVNEKARLEKL